ncbi:MAG: hypothetical protein IPO62_13050 [Saprospiraceae bacterium]|nr:hypothetical protein [Saprospiraceae bacterium]
MCILALKKDSTLWTWGNNNNGQLGHSPYFETAYVPMQVTSPLKWISLSGSLSSTTGIDSEGKIWVWGIIKGLFRIDTIQKSNYPIKISDIDGWKEIINYYYSIYVLKNDSSLWVNSSVYFPLRSFCCIPTYSSKNIEICPNDTVLIKGSKLFYGGSDIIDTLKSNLGCDSFVTNKAQLIVSDTGSFTSVFCNDDDIILFGKRFNINNSSDTVSLVNSSHNGCDSIIKINLTFLDQITVNEQINHFNDSILIKLNVQGGLPPYQFRWNTGDTLSEIRVKESGNYIVTITDFNNCNVIKIYYLLVSNNSDKNKPEINIIKNETGFLINNSESNIEELIIFNSIGQLIKRYKGTLPIIQIENIFSDFTILICVIKYKNGLTETIKLFK